jgi:hypothetical protein
MLTKMMMMTMMTTLAVIIMMMMIMVMTIIGNDGVCDGNNHHIQYKQQSNQLFQLFSSQFVHINNLKLICRAHQLVHEGYKYMFDEKLVTVWSAPNYCYRCGNIASILSFTDANTREPKLFQAVPDYERVIPPRTTTPYFL